jgi:hypothetical protein
MKLRSITLVAILVLVLISCHSSGGSVDQRPVRLAEFTESYVHVSIILEPEGQGQAVLTATFTPTEPEAHLYSKDLSRDGINGLGRPTLLELPAGAWMQATGDLVESVSAMPDSVAADLPALPVYPAGAVTLTLPVLLPETGGSLVDDQVLITYMACTPTGCHKPVLAKLVEVQVPGR